MPSGTALLRAQPGLHPGPPTPVLQGPSPHPAFLPCTHSSVLAPAFVIAPLLRDPGQASLCTHVHASSHTFTLSGPCAGAWALCASTAPPLQHSGMICSPQWGPRAPPGQWLTSRAPPTPELCAELPGAPVTVGSSREWWQFWCQGLPQEKAGTFEQTGPLHRAPGQSCISGEAEIPVSLLLEHQPLQRGGKDTHTTLYPPGLGTWKEGLGPP